MGNGYKVGRRLVYFQSALLILRPLPFLWHFSPMGELILAPLGSELSSSRPRVMQEC
jgi:hypothetical protein